MTTKTRRFSVETKKEISAMPIHYDIETDALYLEGKEKGIEQNKWESVANLLRTGKFTKAEIAEYLIVDLAFVAEVERELLGGSKN